MNMNPAVQGTYFLLRVVAGLLFSSAGGVNQPRMNADGTDPNQSDIFRAARRSLALLF
jgi:hypothetical protein